MDKHAIFMAFDKNFGKYAKACINSIKANYPGHPEILVFYRYSEDGDEEMIEFLKSQKKLKIMDYTPDYSFLESANLGPVASDTVYLRYMLWTSQFDEYDNILHLDADTLVMKPLDWMFEQENFFITPNHEYFEFVRVFPEESKKDKKLLDMLKKDKLEYPSGMDDMANAGIFVIPKKYRTKKHYNKLIQITEKYRDYLNYADQSAISLWCRHFGIPFQDKYEYNFQTPFIEMVDVKVPLEDACIIHFSSKFKPDSEEFKTWWRLLKYAPYLTELFESYLESDLYKTYQGI